MPCEDMEEKSMRFEEAIKRLESIASELEKETTDLDASLKLYEEGVALVRFCNERLESAQRKIQILSMAETGEICEVPFAENATGGESV